MKKATKRKRKMTKLARFKKVCCGYLLINDTSYIDVIFGVIFANRLDAKPIWLFIVGPPSSGKTVILQSLGGHIKIYLLTNLTTHTLVSGKSTGAGEPDPSLLPKLDRKILVIKDFTVLLTGKYDTVIQVFGQLRDIYDGTTRASFGTGKDIEYKAKFGIIAAVTGEIDRHLNLLTPLGERFLMYRLPSLSEDEIKSRTLLAAHNKSMEQQEKELKEAAHAILNLNPKPATMSEELKEELADVAQFVAIARAGVTRDRQTKEIISIPDPEIPTRLVKQLVCLAQGIAMARERSIVTKDEVKLVSIVGLDSIPPMRLKLIYCLAEVYPKSTTVAAIANKLKLNQITIRRWLEVLYALIIVSKSGKSTSVKIPDDWKLKRKYGRFFRKMGL